MSCSPVQACTSQHVLLRSNQTDKMNQISHHRMPAQTRNADPTGLIRVRQPNRYLYAAHKAHAPDRPLVLYYKT